MHMMADELVCIRTVDNTGNQWRSQGVWFWGGGGGRTPEHVPSENLEMRTLLTRVLRVKFCRIPKIKSGTKGMIFYDLKNLSSDHQTFFRRIKWIAKSEILS